MLRTITSRFHRMLRSRQRRNMLARPVEVATTFGRDDLIDVLLAGCRVPQAAKEPRTATDRLKAAIVSHGIVVEYARELGGALGTSSSGCIQVLAGLQPASEFMVLAHEFAHLCLALDYVRFLVLIFRLRRWRFYANHT